MVVVMIYLRSIMSKSGKYFSKQQNMLGKENGYIEEMMEGARVVKVFNYEDKAIENFTRSMMTYLKHHFKPINLLIY